MKSMLLNTVLGENQSILSFNQLHKHVEIAITIRQ